MDLSSIELSNLYALRGEKERRMAAAYEQINEDAEAIYHANARIEEIEGALPTDEAIYDAMKEFLRDRFPQMSVTMQRMAYGVLLNVAPRGAPEWARKLLEEEP